MDFESSIDHILRFDHEFGDLFYDVFFEEHPEAKEYFKDTDMKAQSVMMMVALRLIGDFRKRGYAAIDHYLRILGTRHSDHQVPREMYPKWRDSLLSALEKYHGENWNDAVADEWRESVDAVSEVMFKGYDQRTRI